MRLEREREKSHRAVPSVYLPQKELGTHLHSSGAVWTGRAVGNNWIGVACVIHIQWAMLRCLELWDYLLVRRFHTSQSCSPATS